MNVSPTILSWGLIPMSLAPLASSTILLAHSHSHTLGSVPFLWRATFYIGGFVLVFVALMLLIIRRGEHTRFVSVDKVALATVAISIAVFVAICLKFKYGQA